MAYKSLLGVVTAEQEAAHLTAQLAQVAAEQSAHAEVFCLGVDRTQNGYDYAGLGVLAVQDGLKEAQDHARVLLEQARAALNASSVEWAAEAGVALAPDLGRVVARRARFADLLVAARPYGDGTGPDHAAIVEAALFGARIPALVLPGGTLRTDPDVVVVAWNESAEAMAAIRAALPLLQQSSLARITVIDPPRHGPERSDPGGALGQWLSRHGVRCEIDVLAGSMPRVSDVLNRHVADTGANMVVMGAYGHSRFREAILGGATRNMLEQASVPVLMAH